MLGKIATYISLGLFAFWWSFSIAQEPSEYEITSFSESLSPQVNVSGGVLVSYQMEGASLSANNESLYIARTKDINQLSVLIKSIDGNYESKFNVSLKKSDKKWQKITFPTQYHKRLKSYGATNVSVIAYTEVPSKRRKKLWRVLPTSWGLPNEKLQYFNVNSSGDFAKYVFKNNEGNKVTEYCTPIEAEVQTAFNYRCPIYQDVRDRLVTFVTEVDGKKDKYKIW